MELSALIRELWEKFKVLLEGRKPSEPESLTFARIPEAGGWRTGTGLWSGLLSIFKARIYYLEVTRTSIADKRQLNLKPSPTHTFKLFYFSRADAARGRVTVFLIYKNCYLSGSSEDFIAVELLGKSIARHLELLSAVSFVGRDDITEAEVVKHPGQLPQLKIKDGNQGIPSVVLLNRSTPTSLDYWQQFIDAELQKIKDEPRTSARRKGIG
jgi:hypothetical protein